MESPKTIKDLFSFPGFVANAKLTGIFGDRYARLVTLRRRKKRQYAPVVVTDAEVGMTRPSSVFETCLSQDTESTLPLNAGASTAQGAVACM